MRLLHRDVVFDFSGTYRKYKGQRDDFTGAVNRHVYNRALSREDHRPQVIILPIQKVS